MGSQGSPVRHGAERRNRHPARARGKREVPRRLGPVPGTEALSSSPRAHAPGAEGTQCRLGNMGPHDEPRGHSLPWPLTVIAHSPTPRLSLERFRESAATLQGQTGKVLLSHNYASLPF